MIITFCGHADYLSSVKDKERLLNLLEKIVQGNKVDFYLGGYGGFDRFALNCTKKYKSCHSNARLVFISPYLNNWLNERKELLETVYDDIIYPELENVPLRYAILKRNEWMIRQADYVFCYVKTHYGGAYKTLLYAHKHDIPYVNLYEGNYKLC
ncbi:MAG: hypothetical protein IKL82_00615 [Clostridia bacterium]|nr:hypothetical protein [Clostridia bacterium]